MIATPQKKTENMIRIKRPSPLFWRHKGKSKKIAKGNIKADRIKI